MKSMRLKRLVPRDTVAGQMKLLTQEAVDIFIKKVTIYRDKRVEIEWNCAFERSKPPQNNLTLIYH